MFARLDAGVAPRSTTSAPEWRRTSTHPVEHDLQNGVEVLRFERHRMKQPVLDDAVQQVAQGLPVRVAAHLAALSTGATMIPSSRTTIAADKARIVAENEAVREERWASQLRLLDCIDPSYRE